MKYFLKVLGYTKDKSENLLLTFEEDGSAFWQEKCKVWFSKRAGSKVKIGDILIQYIPLGQPQESFQGRIVGCYEVISSFHCGNIHDKWFRFVEVKNLNKVFSEKSKHTTMISIKEIMGKIPPAIQCGCAEITKTQAETIIKRVIELSTNN